MVGCADPWSGLVPAARRSIVLTAVELFATQGFHGTSTRQISIGAGLSPAALYAFFPSKEHVLFEIVLRGHQASLDISGRAAQHTGSPAETISEFVYESSRWNAENSALVRIANYELAGLVAEHTGAIRRVRRKIVSDVRGIIDRGIDQGVFHVPDPEGAAGTLMSISIDVARWYRPDGPVTPHAIGELHRDLALRMLGVRSPND